MRDGQSRTSERQGRRQNSVWELPGRRIVSWRDWNLFGAGVYDRGIGEGLWRSDQHRLVFSITPNPAMLLQIDGSPVQEVGPTVGSLGLYPAGPSIRTVGASSRYAQFCWHPSFYRHIAPGLSRAPQIDPLVAFDDPLLGQLLRTLIEEIGGGAIDRLLADSLAAALAMRVAHRFAPPPESAPDLPPPRLRRVVEYIEANLSADLTLAELAGVACLSPCHFSRSFKEAVGSGPQRYTVQRRIERAKALLRRGEGNLADVAVAVGFADQSHFTAVFRRETGTTPGRFRAAAC